MSKFPPIQPEDFQDIPKFIQIEAARQIPVHPHKTTCKYPSKQAFFQYHTPLEDFPYVVDHQVNQNPGMAKHMDYDSVILGSSMTVNFNTGWFEELLGLKTLKLSYSGAFPKQEKTRQTQSATSYIASSFPIPLKIKI